MALYTTPLSSLTPGGMYCRLILFWSRIKPIYPLNSDLLSKRITQMLPSSLVSAAEKVEGHGGLCKLGVYHTFYIRYHITCVQNGGIINVIIGFVECPPRNIRI